MKRSQNNARDLGKLRGDVRNPHAIEEIKKLLLESHLPSSYGDPHDPERKRELDHELASKLDALLKLSSGSGDRQTTAHSQTPNDHYLTHQTFVNHVDQTHSMLQSIQNTLNKHLPLSIPEPFPAEHEPLQPVKVTLDTSALENTLGTLDIRINAKLTELQRLDDRLLNRRAELSNLEIRASALQSQLAGMVRESSKARAIEIQRVEAERERRKNDAELKKKKSVNLNKRALLPLATTADRRIVSLSNVGTPPRKVPQSNASSSRPVLAPPLQHESPFTQSAFTLPSSVNPAGGEIKLSPHRPMQTTLRTPPVGRKASWSRRVSQIFLSSNNKENSLGQVHEDLKTLSFSKSPTYDERHPPNTFGRNSMRSFRSFSHR